MSIVQSSNQIQGAAARFSPSVRAVPNLRLVVDRLFFVIPGAFLIIDLALMGSGQWSEMMGFSVRKALLLLTAGYATAVWAASARIPQGLAMVLGLAIFVLVWCVDLPLLYNTPLPNALSDSQLFLGLLFAPAFAQMVARTNCWPGALRLIERLLWILALLHISIFWYEKFSDDGATALVAAMRSVLEPRISVEDTSVFIGPISDGFRVFWGSSVFLLLGLYLAVRNFNQRRRVVSIGILLTIVYAITLTLTRGMILSTPLFFLLSWLFGRLLIRVRLGAALYLLVGVALLALTVPIVLMANPHFLTVIGLGRAISDDLRYEQIAALAHAILTRPWLGHGLGASVQLTRSEVAPWSYELSILALYMKIGLVGAVWLVAVFVWGARSARVHMSGYMPLSATGRRTLSRIAALLFCIVFCSNTNPYLFSMLGWGLLMFVYLEFCAVAPSQNVVGAAA